MTTKEGIRSLNFCEGDWYGDFFFIVALRPRKRDGLLGTGTEWEGDDRVKARPLKLPEKDRRDRGPPPEQSKC